MQTHKKYSIPLFDNDKDEEIKKVYNNLKEENYRLQLENDQLKKELEKEQLLHKTLYNEWKELKSGTTFKKIRSGKLKRIVVRKKSSYYGLFAMTILLLSAFIFYLWFSNRTVKSEIPSQVRIVSIADTPVIVKASKNKVQRSGHKLPSANPTIKTRQKRNSLYPPKKDSSPSYQNEPVNNNESAGLQKTNSTSRDN